MKIAFVVSGNGYGHLKRVCSVVEEIFLVDSKSNVVIAGATAHGAMLDVWKYTDKFSAYAFSFLNAGLEENLKTSISSNYSFDAYIQSFNKAYQILDTFSLDVIVSDNLAGILDKYPRTILMGSFLWPDTLLYKYAMNPEIKKICGYEDALLSRVNPVMLGLDDMVMPYVKEHTRFMGLPWFCKQPARAIHRKNGTGKSQVLLTGGGTRNASARLLDIGEQLLASRFFDVTLDFSLYHQVAHASKERYTLFDFSAEAFVSLDRIICRPGIGILTDAIQYRIPVCVLEEDDKEMQFNCDRVEAMGIGVRAIPDNNAIADQLLNLNAESIRNHQAERKTGGAAMAAHYILNS